MEISRLDAGTERVRPRAWTSAPWSARRPRARLGRTASASTRTRSSSQRPAPARADRRQPGRERARTRRPRRRRPRRPRRRRGLRRGGRSRPRHRAASTCRTCSSASTRRIPPARAAGPASAWRSRWRTPASSGGDIEAGASPATAPASRSSRSCYITVTRRMTTALPAIGGGCHPHEGAPRPGARSSLRPRSPPSIRRSSSMGRGAPPPNEEGRPADRAARARRVRRRHRPRARAEGEVAGRCEGEVADPRTEARPAQGLARPRTRVSSGAPGRTQDSRVATAALQELLAGPTEASGRLRHHDGDPRRHATARDRDRQRGRDGRPRPPSSRPAAARVAPASTGAGRLHADGVPDREAGAVRTGRLTRERPLQPGRRLRPPGRAERLRRARLCGDSGVEAGFHRRELSPAQ